MNDPNGLVYLNGVYHLFYQAGEWPRRWDHAVSKNLVTWQEKGTKIPATDCISPFSGGAVVDKYNTAGFGKDALVMMYTGHHIESGVEDQRLAYSTDNGETVRKYEPNPVIPSNTGDFRDPNPFWYEADESWRMVVSRVEATDERPAGIEIYSSENLKDWTYESTYGSGGEAWECPSLFKLHIEDSDEAKWIMTISTTETREVEHHIGHFDGTEFISKEIIEADYGYDFYATQKWSNTPQERGLNISWMSNWYYAMDLPDNGWQGAMTVPRTITLLEDGFEMRQHPAEEITQARKGVLADINSGTISNSNDPLSGDDVSGRSLEIITTIALSNADKVGLRVREGEDQKTVIKYDKTDEELRFDRTDSGIFFSDDFYGTTKAPMKPLEDGTIKLRILIDSSSVEVFANEGRRVMTNRIYPDYDSTGVSMFAEGGSAEIRSLVAYDLKAKNDVPPEPPDADQ